MLDRDTRWWSTLWLLRFPRRNLMGDRQRTWRHAAYRCGRGLGVWMLGLLLLPLLAQAEQFTGKVVYVRAGDTLSGLRGSKVVQVRLYGVVCPASRQPFGAQARQFTRGLAYRQTVAVVVDTVAMDAAERRGQLIAAVQLPDGRDLSQVLVQA